jgi:hypothetical protein
MSTKLPADRYPGTDPARAALAEGMAQLLRLLAPAAADPRLDYSTLTGLASDLADLDRKMPLEDHPVNDADLSDRVRARHTLRGYTVLTRLGDFRFDYPECLAVAVYYDPISQQVIATLAAKMALLVDDYTRGSDRHTRGFGETLKYVEAREHVWERLAAADDVPPPRTLTVRIPGRAFEGAVDDRVVAKHSLPAPARQRRGRGVTYVYDRLADTQAEGLADELEEIGRLYTGPGSHVDDREVGRACLRAAARVRDQISAQLAAPAGKGGRADA